MNDDKVHVSVTLVNVKDVQIGSHKTTTWTKIIIEKGGKNGKNYALKVGCDVGS